MANKQTFCQLLKQETHCGGWCEWYLGGKCAVVVIAQALSTSINVRAKSE